MKSSGTKRVMRQNKKIPFLLVFASNIAQGYVKIFSRKTSYKACCGRLAISVLLQNGISDSDLFPQNGLCSPRTGTASAPAHAPRLRAAKPELMPVCKATFSNRLDCVKICFAKMARTLIFLIYFLLICLNYIFN